MIDTAFVRRMARYNAWQNHQLYPPLLALGERDPSGAAIVADRGVFWGSILGTLNHIVWADWVWMARFEGRKGPDFTMQDSPGIHDSIGDWAETRVTLDRHILTWADGVRDRALKRDLTWYSGLKKADVSQPLWGCVVHFFNHQTHHRGQVHAMLTQAGVEAPVTDLFIMPETGDWLS